MIHVTAAVFYSSYVINKESLFIQLKKRFQKLNVKEELQCISCCNVFKTVFKKIMIFSNAEKFYPILMLLSRIYDNIRIYLTLMKCDLYDEHLKKLNR